MASDIRMRTIRGVSWTAVSQIVTQSFGLAITILLAQMLGPKVYGLIGMVTVLTGFAALFGGLGLGAAIVQRKELEARHLDAAFWANAVVGGGMVLLMTTLAPLVGWFYHEPRLVLLTAVIAWRFIIDALNVVQIALLNREMRFRAVAAIQIGSTVTGGLVGLGMALQAMGVWSLVVSALSDSVVTTLLAWKLAGWRPRWSFEFKACKELLGFSASVLGFDVVNYWARSLDRLLIGRFVGASGLGIYSRAYSLMLLPLTQVSRVIGNVMFPAMSAMQDDKPRVKHAYLKVLGIIALLTFPMMVGLFAVAEHFVLALLGTKWAEIIPILKLFCWVGLIQSILSTVGWIYTSQGKTGLYFRMGIVASLACIIAFFAGIHWGIKGVAWSYCIVNALWTYPFFTVPARLIGLSFFEAAKSLTGTFLCSSVMGVVVWSAGLVLPAELTHGQILVIQVPLGVVAYLTLVASLKLHPWLEVRRVWSERSFGLFRLHAPPLG